MPELPRIDSHRVWDSASERLAVKKFHIIRREALIAVIAAEGARCRPGRSAVQEMEDSLSREPDASLAMAGHHLRVELRGAHRPPGISSRRSQASVEDARCLREAVMIRARAMTSPRSGALAPDNGRSLPWS